MIDCWGLSYQTFTLRLNFLFHQQIVRAPFPQCAFDVLELLRLRLMPNIVVSNHFFWSDKVYP
jgi:hypothetical protein